MHLGLFREMTCDDVSDVLVKEMLPRLEPLALVYFSQRLGLSPTNWLQPNSTQLRTRFVVHVCVHMHTYVCVYAYVSGVYV